VVDTQVLLADPLSVAAAFASAMAVTMRFIPKTPLSSIPTGLLTAELPSFINLSICLQGLHTAHKFDEKFLPRQVVVAIFQKASQGTPHPDKGRSPSCCKTLTTLSKSKAARPSKLFSTAASTLSPLPGCGDPGQQ
jgi:hypothetical protein